MQSDPIHDHRLPDDGDGITRNSDNALHIVYIWVSGIVENNNVAALGRMEKIGEPIDKDVFLIVQRRLHAWTIDIVMLDRQAYYEEQQQRQCYRFQDIAQEPVASLLFLWFRAQNPCLASCSILRSMRGNLPLRKRSQQVGWLVD